VGAGAAAGHTFREGQRMRAHAQQLNTKHEAVQQQVKLTRQQATTVAQPCELPQSEPSPEAERILMVDFAASQVQAKGGAPLSSCVGGPDQGCRSQATKHATIALRRWGGRVVPPTSRDPCHLLGFDYRRLSNSNGKGK
jgi:hypothetical protein